MLGHFRQDVGLLEVLGDAVDDLADVGGGEIGLRYCRRSRCRGWGWGSGCQRYTRSGPLGLGSRDGTGKKAKREQLPKHGMPS